MDSKPTEIDEQFFCPHCAQHIPDKDVINYAGRRAASKRSPETLRALAEIGSQGGRPREINNAKIRRIRRLAKAGDLTFTDIARKEGISPSVVSRIVNRAGIYAR